MLGFNFDNDLASIDEKDDDDINEGNNDGINRENVVVIVNPRVSICRFLAQLASRVVLVPILVLGILRLPDYHNCGTLFLMIPFVLLLHLIMHVVALAVAIRKLCNGSAPVQQQHQRAPLQHSRSPRPRLPHARRARAFGRPRRHARQYSTQGLTRLHARRPRFTPTLPSIAEGTPCYPGRPPLYPRQQHQAVPSPPSRKRKANDDSLDDAHSSKREKQSGHSLFPTSTVTVDNRLLEDSVDDVGGDFYFSSHYDDCVDSTEDGEDSLTYSESSEVVDEELFGLDLFPDTDDDRRNVRTDIVCHPPRKPVQKKAKSRTCYRVS